MKDVLKEWNILAPWGKIALISWGNPQGEPTLLVHGRQDSAATFIPLLELLPDKYNYIAIDLPGHGKSDPFPTGVVLMRHHFIAAVSVAIDQLEWNEFIYMAHSMGTELGLFYNSIHPNRITKFILLDPGLSLVKMLDVPNCVDYYKSIERYYQNYKDYVQDTRVYSKQRAIEAVKRVRGMSDDQAELILSRNLKKIGPDMFKLSWDKRLKELLPWQLSEDFSLKILTRNTPPTLIVLANDSLKSVGYEMSEKHAIKNALESFRAQVENFQILHVAGGHDVHFTNPERLAEEVCVFLEKEFVTKAKL